MYPIRISQVIFQPTDREKRDGDLRNIFHSPINILLLNISELIFTSCRRTTHRQPTVKSKRRGTLQQNFSYVWCIGVVVCRKCVWFAACAGCSLRRVDVSTGFGSIFVRQGEGDSSRTPFYVFTLYYSTFVFLFTSPAPSRPVSNFIANITSLLLLLHYEEEI